MTGEAWVSVIVGSLIPTLAILFKYWVDKAYQVKAEARQKVTEDKMDDNLERHRLIDQHVGEQIADVKAINAAQTVTMDSIHRDINGRVAELVAAKVDEKIRTAVATALATERMAVESAREKK